jgi:excisionase family DNA binding protein
MSNTVTPQRREFLTVQETAAHLNVHPQTIRRHIANGRLPAVRLTDSGPMRIPREALDAYLWSDPRGESADA